MTAYWQIALNVQVEQPKPLLDSFSFLFFLCKILGINSQDWEKFRKYKYLKKSQSGGCLVVIGVIIVCVNFNLMIMVFQSQSYLAEKNSLAIVIGFILTYYGLALYISDRINGLLKQQRLSNIFVELQEIDEDLSNFNIYFNNNCIKYRLMGGIFMALLVETITFILSFTYFVDKVKMTSWLWIYGYIPTFFNTLDKLWYTGVLIAIRKRFESINNFFDMEALSMGQELLKQNVAKKEKTSKTDTTAKKCTYKNQIRPEEASKTYESVFGDVVVNPLINSVPFEDNMSATHRLHFTSCNSSTSTASTNLSLEDKFNKFCQLHNTLCSVTQQLNKTYNFPNLMQMGHGFCIVTAQLYFFYSANVGQVTPALFRPAENWWISFFYILYISSKCVSICYSSWLTSTESRKTGVCIHRCGMASDSNDTYELVNHLSLKLFNHPSEFSVCGYFPLNMRTLLGLCGGITTYLIVLIQFNLEEQQVKFNSESGRPMELIRNDTRGSFIEEDVINGSRSENITSLLTFWYQTWTVGP